MKVQWPALLAGAIAAVLGTAGILWAATSSPSPEAPPPAHRTAPMRMHMPGMHMSHGAAGLPAPRRTVLQPSESLHLEARWR